MAAIAKKFVFDPATRELWRVAESGDTEALAGVLSRGVDINARNQHGMTALMRAALDGHEGMVRALLEFGADPNITRNDKFTALALAAFFGHTETVRILIENGAKTEIVTRSGTSPKMWATARTFTEAARCFEQRPRPVAVPAPVAAPAPVAVPPRPVAVPRPVVVKTLKDPPEIWDLVREEPRGFNARSAFVARIKSKQRTFAIGACAALLLMIACGVGALVLRNSQARNLPAEVPQIQTQADTTVSPPVNVETPAPVAPAAETEEFLSAHAVKKAPVKRQPRRYPVVDQNVIEVEPSREVPAAPAVVANPQVEKPRTDSPAKSSTPSTLSPQLITPAKSAPPKGKVIQWP